MLTKKQLGLKIREMRENKGLSQEGLAKKTGLSRAAVSQVEIGNRYLDVLELAKIADVFGISVDALVRIEEATDAIESKKNINIDVKQNFQFSKDKLENLILYILEKCGGKPNVGETVIYKLLYFMDFDNFELYGQPITGMNYVKLQYGPVPTAREYKPVIDAMIENNKLKIITQNYHGMTQKRYIALIEANKDFFSQLEINNIDNVISFLSNKSAVEIENYVHGDAPWKLTEFKTKIPYIFAFERSVPYAHVNYDELWQDVGAKETLKELGEMSDEEYNYYQGL